MVIVTLEPAPLSALLRRHLLTGMEDGLVSEPVSTPATLKDLPPDVPTPPSTRRVVIAGMIGTVIEYFDFIIYATISGLVFGKLFFPSDNAFVSTMLVWATFAVGYLARPLGGIIFGHFGDKIGRSKVLFLTLGLMGVSTTLIGLLPTYNQIGIAAPIILICLRVVQGFGVGGEYGGAATMVVEHAHDSGKRGFFGSLMTASSSVGLLVASGIMALMTSVTTPEELVGWAWRIPFLLSAGLLAVGFYIRYRVGETPVMEKAKESNETVKMPLIELVTNHWRPLLIALAVPFGMFAEYYVILIFSVPFAVQQGSASESTILTISTIAQVIVVAAVIGGGFISDKIGRRVPILVGAVGMGAWSFAFFPLLLSGSVPLIFLAFAVAMILHGLIYGPMATYLVELFQTQVRFTGLSFGYQVSAAIAGGLSPLAATYLIHETGSWIPVAALVAGALAITCVAVVVTRDRTNTDLSV